MKTFKEFQKESYSRLDEGWGGTAASEIWKRLPGAVTGNMIYNTVGPDVRKFMPGKDGKKIKDTKTNMKGEVASSIIGGLSDQIVKKGWKHVAKPALTGIYNVGKFGVTTAVPWALKQVFGGGVDRI